jgi:hypothetical protein
VINASRLNSFGGLCFLTGGNKEVNLKPKPLKWHYFMINFSLWVGAILNFIQASIFMNGSMYGNLKQRIYTAFPQLPLVDITYGLAMIAVAVYMIYTRFQLAGFKKDAPNKLLSLFAVGIASGLIYTVAFYMATGVSLMQGKTDYKILGHVIAAAVMLISNKMYYDKRKELFVN